MPALKNDFEGAWRELKKEIKYVRESTLNQAEFAAASSFWRNIKRLEVEHGIEKLTEGDA